MKKNDFPSLDQEALEKEIDLMKKELFNLKLNASAMQVKDYSQFRKLRVRIARAKTELRQRELAQQQ